MSDTNRSELDDFAVHVVGFLLGMLWAIPAGLIALIIHVARPNPEDKLCHMGETDYWGTTIEVVQCPECHAANYSDAQTCSDCGASLFPLPDRWGGFRWQ